MAERWKGANWKGVWRGREASSKAEQYIAMAVEAAAVKVWSHAKIKHPFQNQTYELEKSIRIEKTDIDGGVVYEVLAGVGESAGIRRMEGGGVGAGGSKVAYYALYVELGTRKMAARPFLRPAFNYGVRGLRRNIAKIMRRF